MIKKILSFYLWASYIVGSVIFIFLIFILLMNLFIKPYNYFQSGKAKIIKIFQDNNLEQDNSIKQQLLRVYPGKGIGEIKDILKDSEGYPIEPTREYQASYRSRYVNVSKEGYRIIANQRGYSQDKKQKNIFIFGGSTTWGYRLPDNETIASYVQDGLNKKDKGFLYNVFNYAICSGYSKYEKRYLERLIMHGRTPDYVIFIDGLNDFCRVALRWPEESNKRLLTYEKIFKKYVFEPYIFWKGELSKLLGVNHKIGNHLLQYDEKSIEQASKELIFNWRAIKGICNQYDIKCIFVLQPIPVYDYPLEKNLFLDKAALKEERAYYMAASKGYRLLLQADILNSFKYLDLHKLQIKGYEYLDSCHYTADFSKRIAEYLVEEILRDKIRASDKINE
ncbi:MAG: SGNH/GDSL hydrolase family protein [Candidatus Omnitrophica bacterium]|nr:SGNH/GDSL hydrolase family protein [Candidatus Omnitrophota bacterium]MDD5591868.1 SGNH/GDSL hydrolase family protein [Candidatus Omnitrophota bacterium]